MGREDFSVRLHAPSYVLGWDYRVGSAVLALLQAKVCTFPNDILEICMIALLTKRLLFVRG